MTKDDYQYYYISLKVMHQSVLGPGGRGISLAMTAQGWGNRHATSSRENN